MPTWETLCETLKLDATPSTKGYGNSDPEVGLYPEDLFRYVIHHNLKFRMHFFEDEWQEALLKTPIMVLMDGILEAFPDETHWIVLIQYDEQQFTYLDPFEKTQATALKRLEMKQFKLLYTGIACQLFA